MESKLTTILKNDGEKTSNQEKKKKESFLVVTIPSDGGYSWVMVFASFLINFLVDGVINNFGKMLHALAEYFNTKTFEVAFVGSLFNGVYFMASPFASAFINSYGFRITGIVGTIVMSVFLYLSSLTKHLALLIICHIFCGIGSSFLGCIAGISLGQHFDKYRPLAFGISTAGSGAGTYLVFAILSIFVRAGDWRGFMRGESILTLICLSLSLSYIQPKIIRVSRLQKQLGISFDIDSEDSDATDSEELNFEDFTPNSSEKSLTTLTNFKPLRDSIAGPPKFPTMAEVLDLNESSVDTRKLKEKVSHRFVKPKQKKRASTPRPLYRDDIMFVQSINRLDSITPSTSPVGAIVSESLVNMQLLLTRTPKKEGSVETSYCEHIVNALKLLFDLSLFRMRTFRLLALASFFFAMAMFVPYMYLTDRALIEGMNPSDAMLLVSVIGVMSSVLRITFGAILNFMPQIDAVKFVSCSVTIAGIFMIITGCRPKDPFLNQIILAIFYVQGFASKMLLRSIIYADMLGLERLTNVYGLISLVFGIGLSIGTPVFGLLKESTGSYTVTFVIAGVFLILSGISFYFLPSAKKRDELFWQFTDDI